MYVFKIIDRATQVMKFDRKSYRVRYKVVLEQWEVYAKEWCFSKRMLRCPVV